MIVLFAARTKLPAAVLAEIKDILTDAFAAVTFCKLIAPVALVVFKIDVP